MFPPVVMAAPLGLRPPTARRLALNSGGQDAE